MRCGMFFQAGAEQPESILNKAAGRNRSRQAVNRNESGDRSMNLGEKQILTIDRFKEFGAYLTDGGAAELTAAWYDKLFTVQPENTQMKVKITAGGKTFASIQKDWTGGCEARKRCWSRPILTSPGGWQPP